MAWFQKPRKEKPMELRDFVSNTLTQLIDGISSAQEYAKGKGAVVNPDEGFESDFNKLSRLLRNGHRLVHIIEFDIALTVIEDKQLQGGIGIIVPELSIGYQGKIDNQKSAVSRVQFSIPVVLPSQKSK